MKLEQLEQLIAEEFERDCIEDCDKRIELSFIISLCHKIMSGRIKELDVDKTYIVNSYAKEKAKMMLKIGSLKKSVGIYEDCVRIKELESELMLDNKVSNSYIEQIKELEGEVVRLMDKVGGQDRHTAIRILENPKWSTLMSEQIKELTEWKKQATELHFNHSEVFEYMLRNENCKLGVSISSEALRVFKELESQIHNMKRDDE